MFKGIRLLSTPILVVVIIELGHVIGSCVLDEEDM